MASIEVHEQDFELALLEDGAELESGIGAGPDHSIKTAPVITGDAYAAVGHDIFPQRALYGRILEQDVRGFPSKPVSPKLYINTNAPFSAIVCGVQGSGKSHSTSVLLESCLIHDARLGTLPAPLSGIVFHFDTAAGGGAPQPCEAAYLASLDTKRGANATPPHVTVLVLPTTLRTMRTVYAALPNVKVEPLHFSPEDISGERLLAMMKVDTEQKMPLYMECLMTILRGMDPFNYRQFRDELRAQPFDATQKAMLNLRLTLLDSCLDGGDATNKASTHFKPGQLTIVDLSSPFMDASSACGFFDLVLGLFIEAKLEGCGKLVVLDEAHKYLTDNGSSARLTDSLLTVIRQQRHFGARVLISTQEPTVVPSKFLDLCSFVIAHRFSSPQWLKHLANHVPAIDASQGEWFSKVVALRTGEAMLFAPAGLGTQYAAKHSTAEVCHASENVLAPLGQGYLLVRSRLRITLDGGQSILAVATDNLSTPEAHAEPEANPHLSPADAVSSHWPSNVLDQVASSPPAYSEGWNHRLEKEQRRPGLYESHSARSDILPVPEPGETFPGSHLIQSASDQVASGVRTTADTLSSSLSRLMIPPTRSITGSDTPSSAYLTPMTTHNHDNDDLHSFSANPASQSLASSRLQEHTRSAGTGDNLIAEAHSASNTASTDTSADPIAGTNPMENPHIKLQPLIQFLEQRRARGHQTTTFDEVAEFLEKTKHIVGRTLPGYFKQACTLGLITASQHHINRKRDILLELAPFAPLVNVMACFCHAGRNKVNRGTVGQLLSSFFPTALRGRKLTQYLTQAVEAGVINIENEFALLRDPVSCQDMELSFFDNACEKRKLSSSSQNPPSIPSPPEVSQSNPILTKIPNVKPSSYDFGALLSVLRELRSSGDSQPAYQTVRERLNLHFPSAYPREKINFALYLAEAKAAKIVLTEGASSGWIKIA